MKTAKFTLCALGMSLILSAISYAYDIVQVTNTPDVDETDYSIAVFGNTVYAVWSNKMEDIYFDKSLDLGKTWGVYRKIIDTHGGSPKMFVCKTGRIFISYGRRIGQNYETVVKVSDDNGNTFYDLVLPEDTQNAGIRVTINKSGTIIYGIGWFNSLQKTAIIKSFDGGQTFSQPKEIPMVGETIEISEDGKYVYIFYVGGITIEGYPKTVPFLMRSTDYGETFEEGKPLIRAHHWSYALDSEISEAGEVYLAWSHDSYGDYRAAFLQSTDQGVNFTGGTISKGSSVYPKYVDSYSPYISVDRNGMVYATCVREEVNIEMNEITMGVYYTKRLKVYPGSSVVFTDPKKIYEGSYKKNMPNPGHPLIAVTHEGDKVFIMWKCTNDLYCTTFPTNEPPKIDPPIGNKEVNEGNLLDFIVAATDADEDTLTYLASNLPQGAIFDAQTHRFTWIPDYNQAGAYADVKFTVSDGVNTVEETITITVHNTNRSPAIKPIGDKTGNEGELLQFSVSATDPDGDKVTYSMLNAPEDAKIDPDTGLFEWTPTYKQAGRYIVTFVASDGSTSAGETITITVNNVRRPDLTVGAITYSPAKPRPGAQVQFKALIKNIGDMKAGKFKVNLNVAGETKIKTISSLPAGKSTYAVFYWKAKKGTHTVTVTADSSNMVQEQDEGNNSAEAMVAVK